MTEHPDFMSETLHDTTVEKQILDEIEAQNTNVKWLAHRVEVSHHHLYKCLGMAQEKRKLSNCLKKRIEEVLGKEFADTINER